MATKTAPKPIAPVTSLSADEFLVEWHATAFKIVKRLAYRREEFTADDVWEAMPEELLGLVEPRALGSVLLSARRAGIIKATKRYQPTRRPEAHGRPIRVWKSRIIPAAR